MSDDNGLEFGMNDGVIEQNAQMMTEITTNFPKTSKNPINLQTTIKNPNTILDILNWESHDPVIPVRIHVKLCVKI